MKKDQQTQRFEEKLELLEQLSIKMEEGELDLEELLALYEQGIALSESLKKDLSAAKARLQELKDGQLLPLQDE